MILPYLVLITLASGLIPTGGTKTFQLYRDVLKNKLDLFSNNTVTVLVFVINVPAH